MHDDPSGRATGYVCPRCGGAIYRGADGDASGEFRCRIGHAFSPEQLWIEHCTMRNRDLAAAARSLAENADLARTLAAQARAVGNGALAMRLEDEARSEEGHVGQILEMLEGLAPDAPEGEIRH